MRTRVIRIAVAVGVLAVVAIAVAYIVRPRPGPAPATDQPGRLIKAAGTFPAPDGKHTLNVNVTPGGIVDYAIEDGPTGRDVVTGNAGSTYQRWFFFWDPAGNLWVHSSDIGSCVWTTEAGKFTRGDLKAGSPLVGKMPPEVREGLSKSLRKALGV
jgi:hypothetical protein